MLTRRLTGKSEALSAQQKIIAQLMKVHPSHSEHILRSECAHPFICVYTPGDRIRGGACGAFNLPWMEYRICPFCGDCEAVVRDPNIVRRTNDEMCRRKFAIRDHAPIQKINEEDFLEILSFRRPSQRKGADEEKGCHEGSPLQLAIKKYIAMLSELRNTCTHDHVYAYKQDDLLHHLRISTSQRIICSSCGLEEVIKGSPSRTRRMLEKTRSILAEKKPDREINEEELHSIRAHFSPTPCRI